MPQKESEKPPVIEKLYEMFEHGEIPDGIVTSDHVQRAIKAAGVGLGTANPANFLKDVIRSPNANSIWPASLTEKQVTARQRYNRKRVLQFIEFRSEDQKQPFPDHFPPLPDTPVHLVQSASMPFAARQLGRKEETWLTQIVVNLRLIESQLSIFSPERGKLRDVIHLQMNMKTKPEVDAVFLASYGETENMSSATTVHHLVTCEAKQIGQRILDDQIREQVNKAMQLTERLENPIISAVKPIAISVLQRSFPDETCEPAIYIVEFQPISRTEFENRWKPSAEGEELYDLPLIPQSRAIYRVFPPVAGLNTP